MNSNFLKLRRKAVKEIFAPCFLQTITVQAKIFAPDDRQTQTSFQVEGLSSRSEVRSTGQSEFILASHSWSVQAHAKMQVDPEGIF